MDTNFSKYNDDMEEDKEEICNSKAFSDAQVAHTHEFFLDASECSLWSNLEADELLHPNRKPKKKVARKQRSSPLRTLFWQGSWWKVLIFPWMIMPKPCVKRSKTEEVAERYSLS
jgi:hypothetical protein